MTDQPRRRPPPSPPAIAFPGTTTHIVPPPRGPRPAPPPSSGQPQRPEPDDHEADSAWHALYCAIEDAMGEPWEDREVDAAFDAIERHGYRLVPARAAERTEGQKPDSRIRILWHPGWQPPFVPGGTYRCVSINGHVSPRVDEPDEWTVDFDVWEALAADPPAPEAGE